MRGSVEGRPIVHQQDSWKVKGVIGKSVGVLAYLNIRNGGLLICLIA